MLFDTIAAAVPGARAVLRRLVEVGGTASYEEVQDHFAVHPQTPIDRKRIGGTLTSIRAVRRRFGPDNRSNLLERDDRRRIYWIEPTLPGRPVICSGRGRCRTPRNERIAAPFTDCICRRRVP